MSERVICGCPLTTETTQDTIEFDIRDSFKLVYQFSNKNFDPPMLIPLDSFDLTITYYIKDRAETFVAEKKGRIATNCILLPKQSIIKVIFDNHNLKSGQLYADFLFKYYDPELPDRMGESAVTQFTNIILKENSI